MILIADAGGTKIEWAFINDNGAVNIVETPGISPIAQSVDEMRSVVEQAIKPATAPTISEIYYYGTGCISPEVCAKIKAALPSAPKVEVHTDLLGAARALYGDEPGIVGILGTGSNTGLYDGVGFASNMPPMGYIIGDEGSGTYLGKALLRAVYRSYGRPYLREEFEAWLGLSYQQIIKKVYSEPRANAFLASLVPFMAKNHRDFRDELIQAFVELKMAMLRYYGEGEVRFVGGVASAFEHYLQNIFDSPGFNLTKIERRPMPGLIQYHLTHES